MRNTKKHGEKHGEFFGEFLVNFWWLEFSLCFLLKLLLFFHFENSFFFHSVLSGVEIALFKQVFHQVFHLVFLLSFAGEFLSEFLACLK